MKGAERIAVDARSWIRFAALFGRPQHGERNFGPVGLLMDFLFVYPGLARSARGGLGLRRLPLWGTGPAVKLGRAGRLTVCRNAATFVSPGRIALGATSNYDLPEAPKGRNKKGDIHAAILGQSLGASCFQYQKS